MLTFYFFFVALASTLLAATNDSAAVGLSSGVAVLFFTLAGLSLLIDLSDRWQRHGHERRSDIEHHGI